MFEVHELSVTSENKVSSVYSKWHRCARSIQQNLGHFILEVISNSGSYFVDINKPIEFLYPVGLHEGIKQIWDFHSWKTGRI